MTKRAIVIFPAFAQIELIEHLRQDYDPLAAVIRAHLTLVFPFESPLSPEQLALHMSRVAQTLRPFPLHMQGITGYASEYLFLNVKEGNDQLIGLHDQLYTGVLAPYLTREETYLPHLTVGRLSNATAWASALRQAQSVTASFETEIHELIAYRLEEETSGNVECRVRLSGSPRQSFRSIPSAPFKEECDRPT